MVRYPARWPAHHLKNRAGLPQRRCDSVVRMLQSSRSLRSAQKPPLRKACCKLRQRIPQRFPEARPQPAATDVLPCSPAYYLQCVAARRAARLAPSCRRFDTPQPRQFMDVTPANGLLPSSWRRRPSRSCPLRQPPVQRSRRRGLYGLEDVRLRSLRSQGIRSLLRIVSAPRPRPCEGRCSSMNALRRPRLSLLVSGMWRWRRRADLRNLTDRR